MKKYDVVAMGEALIDFTDIGLSENGMKVFEQNPGGAPANVACACARLGLKTAFLGKVGKDMHGALIIDTLKENGVDVNGLVRDEKAFTTLAFVSLGEKGERSFSFSRYKSADVLFSQDEINTDILKNTKVFQFGSLSLTDEPSKSATLECIKIAKESGAVISYDPNYRALLWESEEKAICEMKRVLHLVDIIKISDEEIKLICGTDNYSEAAKILHNYGIKIVLITLGENGAFVSNATESVLVPTEKTDVVDTTGAGDCFLAAFLSKLISINEDNIDINALSEICRFSNKAAGICVSRRGAIPAMPFYEELI